MSRILTLAVAVLVMACCQSTPPDKAGVPQGFEVSPWLLDTPISTGSAVPVAQVGNEILFLTARHCVESGSPFTMNLVGLSFPGRVVSMHDELDLAIVATEAAIVPVFPELRLIPLAYAERLVSAGYPLGEGPFINEGRAGGDGRTSGLQIPGMSGGPVFDGEGYLVGIIVSVMAWRAGPFSVPLSQVGNYQSLHEAETWLRLHGLVE